MDNNRRPSRVIDPKVRKVGFFAPTPPLDGTQSDTLASSPPVSLSPSGNSLSPVMIIPPRHFADNLSRAVGVPVPSIRLRQTSMDKLTIGSYNPPDSVLGSSPMMSPSSMVRDGKFSDESSVNLIRRSSSGKFTASSLPSGGFDLMPQANKDRGVVINEADGEPVVEVLPKSNPKPLKEKTTKAERRALQEAQRAAKAAEKCSNIGGSSKPVVASGEAASVHELTGKAVAAKRHIQKKDGLAVTSATASEKKGPPPEKDRKKDVPPPRMQFDDKNRVEKAKKRSVVKQAEARNRVELFRHLPQYEHGTQLPDLESKFFQLDPVHPAVYKVGLQYLTGDICGGNARCIAMLLAFREAIKGYSTPSEKTLPRDLTAKINSYVSFLIECRPLSISMGNAIRFLKARIANLPLTLSDSDAKASVCLDIDRFINEKIILADKVIVGNAVTKVRDGDVLLTYGSSSVVEMILLHAHELGKQFRVVVVDSGPKLEGQTLVRRLVGKGLSCTYTHINAVSYMMHEATRVFLGVESVLSNGTAYSRVGTACVAMVAHACHVPVLICCEAYKFHERVLLDSICSNELGDPNAISKVPGRKDVNYLDDWADKENLQLLNLVYDVTPSEYISMIISDYGMIPPTSVPVIVREYGRDHLFI
ncbi:hypothetical protein LguiB_022636 [Lonicera macranthoides]